MQRSDTYEGRSHNSAGEAMRWAANGLATILAGVAVASGVIGVLVAFGEIGDSANAFEDGVMWLLGGVLLALAANVFRREHHIVDASAADGASMAAAPPADERGEVTNEGERSRNGDGRAMRDAKDLTGMTVVATDEARDVGTVKDVIFDPSGRAVLGLMVAPPASRESRMFVTREHIRGFGRDAVTIQSESNLQAFATKGREREFSDTGVHLDGLSLMTEHGDSAGKVGKVLLTDDCRIAGLESSGGVFKRGHRIPVDDVVSIGRDRVIVANGHER